jgi:hypothetical protein
VGVVKARPPGARQDPGGAIRQRPTVAGGCEPAEVRVPSIGAGVVASLAGWMVDGLLQPYLGTAVTLLLSFGLSTVVFFVARRWLIELRGR